MKKRFSCALLGLGCFLSSFAYAQSPFDYHSIRKTTTATSAQGLFEGEDTFIHEGKARAQNMNGFGPHWSGHQHLLWDGLFGESCSLEIPISKPGNYQLLVRLTKAPDYGICEILLNGKQVKTDVDLYDRKVILAPSTDLGQFELEAGPQKITLKLTGANPKAKKFRGSRYLLGLDYIQVIDLQPKEPELVEKKELSKAASPLPHFADVRKTLSTYCFRCHGNKKTKGKLHLEKMTSKDAFLTDIEKTAKVVDALQDHDMPPDDEKQPTPEQRLQLLRFFNNTIHEYLESSDNLPPVVMRRMNRYEYNNAVRDLLNLKGDIYPLPERTIRAARPYYNPASGRFPDRMQVGNRTLGKFQIERQILTGVVPYAIDLQAEHGFNNRGDEMSISPILLESFLKLGESIVNSPQFNSYCQSYATIFEGGKPQIRPLLDRAFRRPVDDETVKRYEAFYDAEVIKTKSPAGSMKKIISAILASPHFIYLAERKTKHPSTTEPLDDFELASRLSFFLWSSIPDANLIALAEKGELRKIKVLEEQVNRMLNDKRSQALSENFARQWLRLDQLITAVPDFNRFEVYYSRKGCEQWKFGLQTMIEPLLLFESILVEDRSIMLLVDSNYSYRSDELQNWYTSPKKPFGNRQNVNRFGTNEQQFKRRALATRKEGGVFTTAAVLTMTSSPLRTSPISRGSWMATVILNKPPDPPPDTVPEIEADDAAIEAKGLTLRQRLNEHQANESCASCHAKIDPLGFALENFDAIGRWRDTYSSGLPIDASGKLFGEIEFTDIISFKDALMSRPKEFMTAFTEHLLSYALGRDLTVSDQPTVQQIVQQVYADHGRISTLILEIAKSHSFRYKSN